MLDVVIFTWGTDCVVFRTQINKDVVGLITSPQVFASYCNLQKQKPYVTHV